MLKESIFYKVPPHPHTYICSNFKQAGLLPRHKPSFRAHATFMYVLEGFIYGFIIVRLFYIS